MAPLHPISRLHLDAISTELGIMQHANGSIPDPKHGYASDDVARALQLDLLHARSNGWPAVATSAWRSLHFLETAFDTRTGRFRNKRTMSGHWIYGPMSEDTQGRVMHALGDLIGTKPDRPMVTIERSIVKPATALWERALPLAGNLISIRAQASVLLGCVAILDLLDDAATSNLLDDLAGRLHQRFERDAAADWPWPEPILTYENALLPRALIVAGDRIGDAEMVDTGLAALDWLISIQVAAAGHLSPIGNEWWPQGGVRSRYDQQPIEATSLLLAAEAALARTGESRYRAVMEQAYGWFLGENDLGLWVADPARGSGSDGLTPSGRNTNEGAESTLMWLIAAERIRAMRAEMRPWADGPEDSIATSTDAEPMLASATATGPATAATR